MSANTLSLRTPSRPASVRQIPVKATACAGRVLVVDDHAEARRSMADVLSQVGYHVQCLSSAIEAVKLLEQESVDVVVTDLQMPGMDGIEFIKHLAQRRNGAQAIMVTGHASIDTAVEAMRHGAFDYIQKPFGIEQLEQLVARAVSHGRSLDRGRDLLSADAAQSTTLIGSSRVMQSLRAKIAQLAPTRETVLITGESGTGKELVARMIHALSDRSQAPLVSLNCPVLSAHLMESELFGHERGAFTGADSPRTGRFELADGGAILLDEITEIELPLQAKLLRVLQERSFERVGSSRSLQVDVRVLATTNRDLRAEVAAGHFREDLYYRLNVLPLAVPPLRDRREDVPELAAVFLARAAERLHKPAAELEADAADLLMHYHWPGNVRELENIITRASVLNVEGSIRADDLRPWLIDGGENATETGSMPIGTSLRDMEQQMIESTLEHFGGHRAKTAEALGIGLRTLSGKLKEYGYTPRAKSRA